MTFSPDDLPENPTPLPSPSHAGDPEPAWGAAASRVPPDPSATDFNGLATPEFLSPGIQTSNLDPLQVAAVAPRDPAWNWWDLIRLIVVTIVALIVGVVAVLLILHWTIYPHVPFDELGRNPLVVVGGQSLAYFIILGYMIVLVKIERRRPSFLSAIHWNWPSGIAVYVLAGFGLSIGLQGLAHFLPIPKDLPIDSYFRTPAQAWALSILSVALAPLMEELFFRGFLYPVLARDTGVPIAVFITALAFALLHGAQLMFSWGPVLVIFLVGLVLTLVRVWKNSVAAGVIMHMAYNGTIAVAMFVATGGFRHLERLNQ